MKKKIICGIAAVVLVCIVAIGIIWHKSQGTEDTAVEIKAGVGEEIIYATIDQIMGNDMEVTLLEEEMVERIQSASQKTERADSQKQQTEREKSDVPENGMPEMTGGGAPNMTGGGAPGMTEGEMPNMSGGGRPDMSEGGSTDTSGGGRSDMEEGEMPDMSEGERPDMSEGENPQMPEGEDGDFEKADKENKESEKASYRIPVGTDVVTKLGAVTTFSHLEEGDTIAILIEKESGSILKIWMVM